MTEKRDKVTVEDVIGLIDCEPTDSVEEVRKLRGRKAITKKRFMVDDAGTLIDMETREMYDIVEEVCPLLNEQQETISELSSQRDYLLNENKHMRELVNEKERLVKMLNNVANYMQREHREMPLDDFVEWWNNIATEGLE